MVEDKRIKLKAATNGAALGMCFGGVITAFGLGIVDSNYHRFPINQNVREGFAKPQDLGVRVYDIDKDGKREFYIEQKGHTYLIKANNGTADRSGELTFQKFIVEQEERSRLYTVPVIKYVESG